MSYFQNLVRPAAIAAVYRGLGERQPASFEKYQESLAEWEVIPLWSGDDLIGAILRKDYWLHVGVERTPPASMRRHIREVLVQTIEQHGCVTTKVSADHPQGIDFCERLGFTVMERTEELVYMRCERARYA